MEIEHWHRPEYHQLLETRIAQMANSIPIQSSSLEVSNSYTYTTVCPAKRNVTYRSYFVSPADGFDIEHQCIRFGYRKYVQISPSYTCLIMGGVICYIFIYIHIFSPTNSTYTNIITVFMN